MEETKAQPVMRQALGEAWERLHPTVRRHYDINAAETPYLKLAGTMYEVDHATVVKPFILAAQLFGALLPYRGKDVPVTVENSAKPGRNTLFWQRRFDFPGRQQVWFRSRMENEEGNEIVEYVRFNLGIRMAITERDGALVYTSRGYQWDLGPLRLRLPDWLLLGHAEIVETGRDEENIELAFNIYHPLFGRTFTYSGGFTLIHPAKP